MEAPQHPLQEQAEALGGQLNGLLTGWLDSGGGPASQAQLGNLLSMAAGHLHLQQRPGSQLANQLLSRVAESMLGLPAGGSVLPVKEQGRALAQQDETQAAAGRARVAALQAQVPTRHFAKPAPRRKVRLVMQTVAQPTTAAGAPAALPPTRTRRQLAAVPAGLRLGGAEREVMEGMAQQLPNLVITSQGPAAPPPTWLPALGPHFCTREHVAVRLSADPTDPEVQRVRLQLQLQRLPDDMQQLLRQKQQRSRALVLAARRRIWEQGVQPRRPASAAAWAAAAATAAPAATAARTGSGGSGGRCMHMHAAAAMVGPYKAKFMVPEWEQRRAAKAQANTAVAAEHAAIRKAWREAKLTAQCERMAALKSNDVEAYMRLVQGVRNSKLDKLLAETDQCLRLLIQRLKLAPEVAAVMQEAGEAAQAAGQLGALAQSNEAWNRLASAFDAEVPEQPQLLEGGELREYQMKGLRWLVGLHDHGLNGILADEMGLGKTIQLIALLAYLSESRGESRPALIAVPASVLPNWEAEFKAWAPSLRVVSYKGSADVREDIFRSQMHYGKGAAFDVALTTYECLMGKLDRPRLAHVSWSYIVIDEGHRLKNSGCKLNAELRQYRAAHRLLLTGTPLQNRLEELWSLLNFLMPDLFNSSDDFAAWFGGSEARPNGNSRAAEGEGKEDEVPLDAAMLSEEEALIVTSRLHQVLRPFMLRRLKDTVAAELPQKVERLVPCLPSAYQQALFGIIEGQLTSAAEGKGTRTVNNTVMELRNICNHPFLSKLHPPGGEAALRAHCLAAEVRLCGKLELLDRILVKLRLGGHRVLLFCTMTRLLDVVEEYLDWRGFRALRLDGATSAVERGQLVADFNAPGSDAFVFLLSIRAGGVGLNLQSADTVIMYDSDWNPQMDLQAQARAHRLGQTKEVLVLRLQTSGTVEERIVQVASDKRSMADRSITGGFFDGKTSASDRQRYLLDIIRSSAQQHQQGGSGPGCASGGGQLSDDELNILLARSKEELALFGEEDRRLRRAEVAAWRAVTGEQDAASYSRLAGEAEVQPLVDEAVAAATPVDEDEGREFGRGKRGRGGGGGGNGSGGPAAAGKDKEAELSYRDVGEREFKRLCREGVSGVSGAVKLLGSLPLLEEPHRTRPATRHRKAAGPRAPADSQQQQQQQQHVLPSSPWLSGSPLRSPLKPDPTAQQAQTQSGAESPSRHSPAPAAASLSSPQGGAAAAAAPCALPPAVPAAAAVTQPGQQPEGSVQEPAPQKRKRGRQAKRAQKERQPRTRGAAAAAEVSDTPAAATVNAEPVPQPSGAEQPVPQKRKRGRPRKHPLPSPPTLIDGQTAASAGGASVAPAAAPPAAASGAGPGADKALSGSDPRGLPVRPPAASEADTAACGAEPLCPLSPPEVAQLLGADSVEAARGVVQRMKPDELQDVHARVFGAASSPTTIRQRVLKLRLMQALAGEG